MQISVKCDMQCSKIKCSTIKHFFHADEKITNTNTIDTNVNEKSSKLQCYNPLWLSRGNEKKYHYLEE